MASAAPFDLDPAGLLVFAALARTCSVRSAAQELGIPRSTVSRRLSDLESRVGAPLAVRTARRFALTEHGTALAERCFELEDVMRRLTEVARSDSKEPSGTLRVAVAPVLGEEILPAVTATLLARYPRLSIDARLSADYVDLRRGSVEVALRTGSVGNATDLFASRLGTSVSGCYLSPRYAEMRGSPRTLDDLAQHECILVGREARVQWLFRSGSREIAVPVTGRLRVDNFRVARDAAARGAGIVRVARVFAEPLVASGDLVPVLERYWPTIPLFAVHAGPNPPAPRVRAFIDVARRAVGGALGPESGGKGRTKWRSA